MLQATNKTNNTVFTASLADNFNHDSLANRSRIINEFAQQAATALSTTIDNLEIKIV